MPSLPDVIILCGGAGSRLKAITGDMPKPVATVAGRPFLELLLRQLSRYGFGRVILAAGPNEKMIRQQLGGRSFGKQLVYSPETIALGTGGAVRNAAALVESDVAIIMNGDSYTEADLALFAGEHENSEADAWIMVTLADGRDDCGAIILDEHHRITRFEEKQHRFDPRYINAGIYLVPRDLLLTIPPGLQLSWETDVLPRWLAEGRQIRGLVCSGTCTDIGTPERYRSAQHLLINAER